MATSDAPPAPAPADPAGGWGLLTASHTGASHGSTGQPNQDAVASRRVGPDALAVAVADGHGNKRHFRSVRGAGLAVSIGLQAGAELMDGLAVLDRGDTLLAGGHPRTPDGPTPPDFAERLEGEMRRQLVPAIVTRWREAVRADLDVHPLTGEEEGQRAPGDGELIAYGSTLLLALVWRHWLILAQIGDGDVIGVRPDGSPLRPVPGDPILDGNQTTSLCGPAPEGDFRVRAVDLEQTPLLALLIATDGYGNAQAADPWPEAVSADLAEMIGERDSDWFGEKLPEWARRCASAEGSGDDTTIALLIAPGAAMARQRAKLAAAAPTFRYVRSVPMTGTESDTVRDDGEADEVGGADEPAGDVAEPVGDAARAGLAARLLLLSRQRIAAIAAGVVVVGLLLGFGIPWLLSLGHSAPSASLPAPSTRPTSHSSPASPSPSPSPVTVPTTGSPPPSSLKGAKIKKLSGHTVILLGHKLWWCLTSPPNPTGCRLVDLSKVPSKLQRIAHHITKIVQCGTSGIELPSTSGLGGGVRVTFTPTGLEASFTSFTSPASLASNCNGP